MMPDVSQQGKMETEEWRPAENAPVIMFDRVSKTYGRINALNSVSLGISGGVTGILGMNGAGKSTLFKLMMGKVRPSSGAIRLFGVDPWKNPAPYSRVGFVPEHEKMHDWMTAFDFIVTFARLHGMTRDEAAKEASSIVSTARSDASEIVAKGRVQSEAGAQDLISTARKEAEKKAQKTRKSGQKDLDKIRSEGEANRKTAVDAIINSFVE